jgi:Ca-activated chloride channel family protein
MRTKRTRARGNALSRKLLFFALLSLLVLFSAAVYSVAQTADPVETIRVDSDLVDLQVNVLNHDASRLAARLQPQDFLVFEDGVPQEITFFAAADAPFDLVLLLDLSGSTANKLKLIRQSSKRFVAATRPTDRIAIVTFTDVARVVSKLTSDREELMAAIEAIKKPMGGTNFWDALRYVLDVVARPVPASRRSAVVVMTDGVDNALPDVSGEGSRTTFEELLNLVGHSNAIVFPIYLDTEEETVKRHLAPGSAYETARSQLRQLADVSGTVTYRANKLKDLESVYAQVIRDLGTVYSIGYRPKENSRDGKWHSVRVQLLNHPELLARTKTGYYAKSLSSVKPE